VHDHGHAELIPVCLLTGFLGSKTTVLNQLLKQEALAKTAVIINEFGDIGLDHELVEATTENLVLLQSGCLCCTIRSDLVQTLHSLLKQRASGEVAAFDRVIIETTGLADPAPILHTLMMDETLSNAFRLDAVVATVDAAVAPATIDSQIESAKQIAVADRLLLTKSDLVLPEDARRLEARLRGLNPSAPIIQVHNGAVSAERILDAGLYDPTTKSLDVQKWLNAEAYATPEDQHHHHQHHDDHHNGHGHHDRDDHRSNHHVHDVNRHDDRISAVALTVDEPIPPVIFDIWLETLMLLKGPNILRMKALVHVAGLPTPFVLHGVQHVFHPPVTLSSWPSDDRRTRIVLIGRDLTDGFIEESLTVLNLAGAKRARRGRRDKGDKAA
jgi:G3E family GTPase